MLLPSSTLAPSEWQSTCFLTSPHRSSQPPVLDSYLLVFRQDRLSFSSHSAAPLFQEGESRVTPLGQPFCSVSCGLSSKNVLMTVAHVCFPLSSSPGPCSPGITLFCYWLGLGICSQGRESRGGERLLEENLICKGLHFQHTNRSDWMFQNVYGVL